jgi:hypothetical protein
MSHLLAGLHKVAPGPARRPEGSHTQQELAREVLAEYVLRHTCSVDAVDHDFADFVLTSLATYEDLIG